MLKSFRYTIIGTQERSVISKRRNTTLSAHSQNREELLRELHTNPETGLTQTQVAELLGKHGENRLREKKKKTTLQRFID